MLIFHAHLDYGIVLLVIHTMLTKLFRTISVIHIYLSVAHVNELDYLSHINNIYEDMNLQHAF